MLVWQKHVVRRSIGVEMQYFEQEAYIKVVDLQSQSRLQDHQRHMKQGKACMEVLIESFAVVLLDG